VTGHDRNEAGGVEDAHPGKGYARQMPDRPTAEWLLALSTGDEGCRTAVRLVPVAMVSRLNGHR